MREATTARTQPPALAEAFLALSDGETPDASRRSPLAAVLMALVIALATPLAWLSEPVVKPSNALVATPASKAGLPAPGDDGPDA